MRGTQVTQSDSPAANEITSQVDGTPSGLLLASFILSWPNQSVLFGFLSLFLFVICCDSVGCVIDFAVVFLCVREGCSVHVLCVCVFYYSLMLFTFVLFSAGLIKEHCSELFFCLRGGVYLT